MNSALAHRGPDGEGIWEDCNERLVLGHRRLAVIDLSERGKQPMASPDGRVIVTYNGEVYNHRELREELEKEGVRFSSTSDTETIAAAIANWGIEKSLPRFVGMFAFAAWFPCEKMLYLVRDRFGVKPLYYGLHPEYGFVFGSELRAFEAIEFTSDVNSIALNEYLKYGYIAAPRSIYQDIWKLQPGTCLRVQKDKNGQPNVFSVWRYWALSETVQPSYRKDFSAVIDEFRSYLTESIRLRLISDVPLGAFLSGGVDSSLVVAIMRTVGSGVVRTFTIGFSEPGWPDESGRAEEIARRLETEHTTWVPSAEELRSVAEKLPEIIDEPLADSSLIPTYLVSSLARRHVTVSLSGDGGDEGFLGYDRYGASGALKRYGWLRWAAPREMRALIRWFGRNSSHGASVRLSRGFRFLESLNDAESFYDWAIGALPYAHLLRPEVRCDLRATAFSRVESEQVNIASINRRDFSRYLPDDILAKVDRATMAVGLEAREPLLDHRLIEAALQLSQEFRYPRGGPSKRLLRTLLGDYLPSHLVEGPKRGFAAPIHAWLAGPLADWAKNMASHRDELLDSGAADNLWLRWVNGQRSMGDAELLWRILLLRAWCNSRPRPVQASGCTFERRRMPVV
ncbi:asparagine synthase (glutamine-hydrolyzing) [Methylocaldum sp. RMAD-M]|nr:asparagine synthase (glutamine-hydrolyzing) [Methylocaldum sp. RMAD-M]